MYEGVFVSNKQPLIWLPSAVCGLVAEPQSSLGVRRNSLVYEMCW